MLTEGVALRFIFFFLNQEIRDPKVGDICTASIVLGAGRSVSILVSDSGRCGAGMVLVLVPL